MTTENCKEIATENLEYENFKNNCLEGNIEEIERIFNKMEKMNCNIIDYNLEIRIQIFFKMIYKYI